MSQAPWFLLEISVRYIMAPKVAYVIRNGGGECSFSSVWLWEHYLGNKAELNLVQFTLFVSCWSKNCHIQLLIKYFLFKYYFSKLILFMVVCGFSYSGFTPSLCTTYWARGEGWNAPSYTCTWFLEEIMVIWTDIN